MSYSFYRRRFGALCCLAMAALLLQGCGKIVDCNDADTKKVVLDLIDTHIGKRTLYQQMVLAMTGEVQLTNVKTLAKNDDLKTAQCTASFTFTYNGTERLTDVTYDLAYLQDKKDVEVAVGIEQLYKALQVLNLTERPKKNGIEKIIDEASGNLQHLITWKDGVQHGVVETYNPANGKLIERFTIENGQKTGKHQTWSADGARLEVDWIWTNGKNNGTSKVTNAAGDKLLTHLIFKDGVASGFQSITEEGSTIIGAGAYAYNTIKDGMKDGPFKGFAVSEGKHYLRFEGSFKSNALDGPVREFDPAGALIETKTYAAGQEVATSAVQGSAGASPLAVCLKAKTDAFYQEFPEGSVRSDVLDEWTVECGGKLSAG